MYCIYHSRIHIIYYLHVHERESDVICVFGYTGIQNFVPSSSSHVALQVRSGERQVVLTSLPLLPSVMVVNKIQVLAPVSYK